MRKVLCVFVVNPDFREFAIPELKSLLNRVPVPIEILLQD